MRATSDGEAAPDELSNEARLRRSQQRLEELLASDTELQALRPSPDAIRDIQACGSAIETVARAFELYGARPCLGEREVELDEAGEARLTPRIRTHTYRDVWARVEALASGLSHEGLATPGAPIGICGFGSPDWVVADLAALHRAAISVPLQTGMSASDLERIVRDAELASIVVSAAQLDAVSAVLPCCPSVAALVVMDLREGERAAEANVARVRAEEERRGRRVLTMRELEATGRTRGILPCVLPASRGEADPLMSLMYTSGSTGVPKGAMYTERILRRYWQQGFGARAPGVLSDLPSVTVSYMPLNHAAGRFGLMSSVLRGGLVVFTARSDMSTLFEDLRLVRPTSVFLVPRVAATIYQQYQGALVRRWSGVHGDAERARIADDLTRELGATTLGDRLLLARVGSAPTPPDVMAFLKRCFDVPVIDDYGSTEAGPLTSDGRVSPDLGIEWRLVDVPELGYRTTDQPFPRGELRVRSPFVVPGYYRNERATSELFDEEGFLVTGDIVEQRAPDCLVWIDRAKNVLKLSQGEFVATSRLEGLFAAKSPFVRQIFVYGDGFHPYLLAVVVPDLGVARTVLHARGELVDDAALKALVLGELARIAREEQLRGHEVPRGVVIEREPFTEARGLLTASKKPSRPKLAARYGPELQGLYRAIEQARLDQLEALEAAGGEASVTEKVRRAVGVTLGVPDLDVGALPQSFLQLGGDSLSVVALGKLIEGLTGVSVPAGFLLDPTSSVQAIVTYVERTLSGAPRHLPTFAEIHGAGASTVRASDLRIARFLGDADLDEARGARAPRAGRAEVALLTGANGFLGRFLALELLHRLERTSRRRVYALVRAPSDAAALERLASTYASDPALARRFDTLSSGGRLVALAGDLMSPRLGLTPEAYARLEDEVDVIVHNGALVNHALSYEQLFEPNVLGTVEIARLALRRRRKTLAYVSTVGVSTRVPEGATEIDPSGYAGGYAASKWASELLLRDAQASFDLPVLVFRPSEIMAHSTYRAQVNVPDFFTRLVAGLVYTGMAPGSFYEGGAGLHASFDGEPVDVVARSIAAISVEGPSLLAAPDTIFNVGNPHQDDGVSLDVIVSWIRSAGYRVERIPDYDAWLRTFEERLRALPEERRQHSPLAILDAWRRPQGVQPRADAGPLLRALRAIDPALAELPHVSERLIHRMLADMAALHVIDAPLRLAG